MISYRQTVLFFYFFNFSIMLEHCFRLMSVHWISTTVFGEVLAVSWSIDNASVK